MRRSKSSIHFRISSTTPGSMGSWERVKAKKSPESIRVALRRLSESNLTTDSFLFVSKATPDGALWHQGILNCFGMSVVSLGHTHSL